MVGRALGWLLVCEPPEQSAAELAETLQASKGSISTATRVLLRLGFIERVEEYLADRRRAGGQREHRGER